MTVSGIQHSTFFASGKGRFAADPTPMAAQPAMLNSPLFQQYGIIPAMIPIVASPNVRLQNMEANKESIITRLVNLNRMAAHTQGYAAAMPQVYANPTGSYFVAEAVTTSGQTFQGMNIEVDGQTTMCAEQTATIAMENAFKQAAIANPGSLQEKPKIAVMFIANQNLGQLISPCLNCQDCLASHPAFSADTVFLTFRRDPGSGQFYIHAQTVRDILPTAKTPQQPSMSAYPITMLPAGYTPKAQWVMAQKGLNDYQLRGLMSQTQQQYLGTKAAGSSQVNQAAGVLVQGQAYTASKQEWWSPRVSESPEVLAAASGIQDQVRKTRPGQAPWGAISPGINTNPKVDVVAYYGEETTGPRPSALGKLAYPTYGGPDTLVMKIRNNQLQVSTIGEELPSDYFQSIASRGQATPRPF